MLIVRRKKMLIAKTLQTENMRLKKTVHELENTTLRNIII
jgi:hypothetical protein